MLALFALALRAHPAYLLLLVPLFLALSLLLLSFVVALLNFYYVRVVRAHVQGLDHYPSFRRIFEHFRDRHGIVDYWRLDEFVEEFFRDPRGLDFSGFEARETARVAAEEARRRALRDSSRKLSRQHAAPPRVPGLPPDPRL